MHPTTDNSRSTAEAGSSENAPSVPNAAPSEQPSTAQDIDDSFFVFAVMEHADYTRHYRDNDQFTNCHGLFLNHEDAEAARAELVRACPPAGKVGGLLEKGLVEIIDHSGKYRGHGYRYKVVSF